MKQWLQSLLIAASVLTLNHPLRAQECPSFAYDPCCCPPNFSGLYAGIHSGFTSYSTDRTDINGYFSGFLTFSASDTNWSVGAQIGYDWLWCNKLFGLVYDFDWTNAETDLHFDTIPETVQSGPGQSIIGQMRWFSTVRARTGLAFSDVLFYLTGGAVIADLKTEIINGLQFPPQLTLHRKRWGWTIGFGTEFAFCQRWSLNAEVLYMRFKPYSKTFGFEDSQFHFKFHDDAWTGRVGLNYRFSLCSIGGG